MEAYVLDALQDAFQKHERRIHDAGKTYAQHAQSTDNMIANQAEGVFLKEMRDSFDDLVKEVRRRTPDPVVHSQEISDGLVRRARMNTEASGSLLTVDG